MTVARINTHTHTHTHIHIHTITHTYIVMYSPGSAAYSVSEDTGYL